MASRLIPVFAVLFAAMSASVLCAAEPTFDALRALIKPGEDESRWMQINWQTDVWSARRQAAAEGKPIFLWAGSGGGPAGVC